MSERARVIGITPAAARRETAQAIMEMSVDVQLALGRCDLGDNAGRINRALGDIRRQAKMLLGDECPTAASPAGKPGIMVGYRLDIRDQMEALAELVEPALNDSWPPPQGLAASDDALRIIGLAADSLADRISSYLTLRVVADGAAGHPRPSNCAHQRKLAAANEKPTITEARS